MTDPAPKAPAYASYLAEREHMLKANKDLFEMWGRLTAPSDPPKPLDLTDRAKAVIDHALAGPR